MPPGPPLRSLWLTFSNESSFVITPQLNIPSLHCAHTLLLQPHLVLECWKSGVYSVGSKDEEMERDAKMNPQELLIWQAWKNLLFPSEVHCGSYTSRSMIPGVQVGFKGTLPPSWDPAGVCLNMLTGDISKGVPPMTKTYKMRRIPMWADMSTRTHGNELGCTNHERYNTGGKLSIVES